MSAVNDKELKALRPVGPAMRGREGIEFLVAVAGIDVKALAKSGLPTDVGDLGHIAGLCYQLCRFTQAARSFYERLEKAALRNPGLLNEKLTPLRALIAAVADGENFEFTFKEGTKLRVEGSRFHRQKFQNSLPFVIWGPVFEQGLVTTAAFYLCLTRDTMLVRRCPEIDCRKIFLAVRRSRVFCSHECASQASMRHFKERQAANKTSRRRSNDDGT